MPSIRTKSRRRYNDARIGPLTIEKTYIDRPATAETWIEHWSGLAQEYGMTPLEVATGLILDLPDFLVGRL